MIRVPDAANTRKTDDAATQRNIRFVKCQKWQGYVEWQIFFKWRLNGIALLVTVLAAGTFSFASPTHA